MAREARPKAPKKTSKKAPEPIAGNADPRTPLDGAAFLAQAVPVVRLLEADLLARAKDPHVRPALVREHELERERGLTGEDIDVWLRAFVTQVAVAWVLSTVFVRTLEDRGLLARALIAGPGALEAEKVFFEIAPSLSERDYLRLVFRELEHFQATRALFDQRHNPIHKLAPSAEGAKALLRLFREPAADAPRFRFGNPDTRFLGDLYQDLSESVRERYALLQTPDFVERYILGRTLGRAIERFGKDDATLLDPTCGSGHFLLGAFERLYDEHLRAAPNESAWVLAQKALDQVAGSDINPYAVAIARFRLTLSFLDKGCAKRLSDAPAPRLHLAVVDSLLHNAQLRQSSFQDLQGQDPNAWAGDFSFQDPEEARDVLGKTYAAVVGNPPYITVKDAALRDKYREMYPDTAFRTYSLAAPFLERFFQLTRARGFVGTITANSFMKREFGKRLIERYLVNVNLDGVVNTAGAFIPGHGTPTAILLGSNEAPVAQEVLSVLAKRGEPSTPPVASEGVVWSSIEKHGSVDGFENEYISVSNIPRTTLDRHPWSLGGGGAAELKELLEERAANRLGDLADAIGFMLITKADEIFESPAGNLARLGLPPDCIKTFVSGEHVRDWRIGSDQEVLLPYTEGGELRDVETMGSVGRYLWPYRTSLGSRIVFGGETFFQAGRPWWGYGQVARDRLTGWAITFAEVATHNHFVLDRGGKVFNRTAPIIKLKPDATEDDHLALLAYLNSSTATFYMRQVCMNKGGQGINEGLKSEEWEQFIQRSGTAVAKLPIPKGLSRLAGFATELLDALASGRDIAELCVLQERIDGAVYKLFGLVEDDNVLAPPGALRLGHRRFEVEMIRSGRPSAWFERNGYEVPDAKEPGLAELSLPAEITLIEQPEYKRRWTMPEDSSVEDARDKKLDAIEQQFGPNVRPGRDIRGDLTSAELLSASAAFLAAHRYTDAGMEKRALWERTWALQRKEDEGTITEAEKPIPVPPKYDQKDYRDPVYWRLRGKLDVPKERFISYPGCEGDDGEPIFGWAGWNHLQQAQALAALYEDRRTRASWPKERLIPILAGILELVPWLKQWHNEVDRDSGYAMGNYYDDVFLAEELRTHGLTRDDLRAWRPAARAGRGRKT